MYTKKWLVKKNSRREKKKNSYINYNVKMCVQPTHDLKNKIRPA